MKRRSYVAVETACGNAGAVSGAGPADGDAAAGQLSIGDEVGPAVAECGVVVRIRGELAGTTAGGSDEPEVEVTLAKRSCSSRLLDRSCWSRVPKRK